VTRDAVLFEHWATRIDAAATEREVEGIERDLDADLTRLSETGRVLVERARVRRVILNEQGVFAGIAAARRSR
jgi:hypothetical protein